MKTQELLRRYREKQTSFMELGKAAKAILNNNLKKLNIKYENLYGRVKSFNSFLEKAQDKKMSDPFNEMTDIVGLRVICLFQSDINKVKKVICETFQVINIDDRLQKSPLDVFNYAGIHFDVRLLNFSDDKFMFDNKHMIEAISQMVFEIQVRTICQHAWDSVSHNLFYKGEERVGKDIRRDFHAINGLFYVADTHFEMINKEALKNK